MFDAKSLLDALVQGAGPQRPPQNQSGGLGDLLGQLTGGQTGGGGLGDILSQLQGKLGNTQTPQAPNAAPGSGGLGDILDQFQRQLGQTPKGSTANATPGGPPPSGGQAGGLFDILGQVLNQATSGVKEGAGKLDEMTGASKRARDALGQTTGKSPEELLAQLKDLIANNQLAAGAALGGLGALILGTGTGRSIAAGAAKLGALAMIGGLAYKAYQNYSQGRSPAETEQSPKLLEGPAPSGSGFEPDAVSNNQALLYIRAMIAAASADGRIDEAEQQKILGNLVQSGVDDSARIFLTKEMENPATVEELAAAVTSQEEAVQVFTAARVAIDLDNATESAFLTALANRLGIEPELAQHIDAAARAAA